MRLTREELVREAAALGFGAELLTADEDLQRRIRIHPSLLWKVQKVRNRPGTTEVDAGTPP